MTSHLHVFLVAVVSVLAVILAGCPLPEPKPQIAVSDTAHDFGVRETEWSFEVWNSGAPDTTLEWQASSQQDWISLSPANGDSTGTDDADTVEVTIDRLQMPGKLSYTGTIMVVGTGVSAKNMEIAASQGEGEGEGEGEPIPGEMVSIAAGTFAMGDPWAEGEDDELPVHDVTLSAYEIGKYEVTNQEYADALNWANARSYLDTSSGSSGMVTSYGMRVLDLGSSCQIGYSGGEFVVESRDGYLMADHPVVEVAWYGAAAYCNWLSEGNGLQSCYDTSEWSVDLSRNGYHLPTEAQWERAAAWSTAGGGRHYRYGNGSDSISCATANYLNGSAYCNPLGLSIFPYTSPVGYYTGVSSPEGCYDMSGNIWEWCNDWCCHVYASGSVTDPEGPASRSDRLLRGGSWGNEASYCRSAGRSYHYPGGTLIDVGFRVARTP